MKHIEVVFVSTQRLQLRPRLRAASNLPTSLVPPNQAMARLKELAQSGIHFCVGLDLEPYGGQGSPLSLTLTALCLCAYLGQGLQARPACNLCPLRQSGRFLSPLCPPGTFALPLPACRLLCQRAVHPHRGPGPQHRGARHVVGPRHVP